MKIFGFEDSVDFMINLVLNCIRVISILVENIVSSDVF